MQDDTEYYPEVPQELVLLSIGSVLWPLLVRCQRLACLLHTVCNPRFLLTLFISLLLTLLEVFYLG